VLSVSVFVRRRPGAPPLPGERYWAATPPGRRSFLSHQDLVRRYGAATRDLDKIVEFAKEAHLKVAGRFPERRTVVLTGTVARMESAFNVKLFQYKDSSGEKYRGRTGYLEVPNYLAKVIKGVFGLDDRPMVQRDQVTRAVQGSPPQLIAKAYGFPHPRGDGAGQTIGLLEFSGPTIQRGYSSRDVELFFQKVAKIDRPSITPVSIDDTKHGAGRATRNRRNEEVTLDIGIAGNIAPGAKLVVYFTPSTERGWVDAMTSILADRKNAPSVLSISYGSREPEHAPRTPGAPTPFIDWSDAAVDAVHDAFRAAAALGITVLAVTGDDGSNCKQNDGRAHVEYPASDPWVTACGGTMINRLGPPLNQGTWKNGANRTTGGGVSWRWPRPLWQANCGVPTGPNGQTGRGIPDVAGNADPENGYGYPIYVFGERQVWGGTSAVAPMYAGLVALLNAELGARVGFLNPTLYQFGGGPVYEDIADGANNAVVYDKKSHKRSPGSYVSIPGWDACTGWGTINGTTLLEKLTTGGEIMCAGGEKAQVKVAVAKHITDHHIPRTGDHRSAQDQIQRLLNTLDTHKYKNSKYKDGLPGIGNPIKGLEPTPGLGIIAELLKLGDHTEAVKWAKMARELAVEAMEARTLEKIQRTAIVISSLLDAALETI